MVVAKNRSAHTVQRKCERSGRAIVGDMEATIIATIAKICWMNLVHHPSVGLISNLGIGTVYANLPHDRPADGALLLDPPHVRNRLATPPGTRRRKCLRLLHRQPGGRTAGGGDRRAAPHRGGESPAQP